MTRTKTSLPESYFDRLYAGSEDPWNFTTSAYERTKYEHTLAALGNRRFSRGLEVGCSIGVLTAHLADLCDELVAVDISTLAVHRARERLSEFHNVTVEHMQMPNRIPSGTFDLIVCSEVLYYWTPRDVRVALRSFRDKMRPSGILIAVHWRNPTKTYPMQGDEVHELLQGELPWSHRRGDATQDYRLDVYEAPTETHPDLPPG